MNKNNICYTGVGSINKTGNHTKTQFIRMMNKTSNKECAVYIKSLKCKSCQKWGDIFRREIKRANAPKYKNKTYKRTNKTEKKLKKLESKCEQCQNNNTKKCNLNNYILFSGARLGKCET
jgi:hypothetical protein